MEAKSYSSICEVVDEYLNTTKVPNHLKKEPPSISCTVQSIVEEEDAEEIQGMLNSVSVLNQVTTEDMAEEQKRDPILALVCPYVAAREKLKSLAISKLNQRLYGNTCYNLTDLHLNREFCIDCISTMMWNIIT